MNNTMHRIRVFIALSLVAIGLISGVAQAASR